VFAAQVADLAGGGLGGFADGRVAALVGVEVAEGGGTVAGRGDGVDVDLVDWVGRKLVAFCTEEVGGGSRRESLVGVVRRLLTEWAFRRIWEVEEVDVEVDPRSVGVGYSLDLSLYAVSGWEGSYIGDQAGVVFGDGGVAQLACSLTQSEAGRGNDSEEERLHDRSCRH
jgi:hypothetical protein